MMNYGMMKQMMGTMYGIGYLGFIIELLVVVVLILLIAFLWKQIHKR